MIWNVQQTVKMRPHVDPRRPRASQTLPKWSPSPSPIRFLCNFGACCFLVAILQHFFQFYGRIRLFFFLSRPLKFMRPRIAFVDFHKFCYVPKKYDKSSNNLPETFRKPRKKSEKNRWKKPRGVRKAKNALQIRQK